MSGQKQCNYIEGVNAAENAYNSISDSTEGLRSVLDMSFTEVGQAIFWLTAISNAANKAISVLANTEEPPL